MVLRCSLLGHDFGDPEVEREREERGSEVVVTVREYEECARCGDVRVVSESTEVTSLTYDDAASIPDDESTTAAEPEDDLEFETDEITDDAEILDATGDDAGDIVESVDAGAVGDPHEIDDRPDSSAESIEGAEALVADDAPITDDGEILEDHRPDDDRAHGEWPDSDDVGPPVGMEDEPTSWPDAGPQGESEAPDENDAIEDDIEPTDDAVFVDDDRSAAEPAATDSGTGIASVQPAPSPGERTSTDPVAAEYFCPNCSFVAPVTRGSLRPGDICPECKRGYLGERELE